MKVVRQYRGNPMPHIYVFQNGEAQGHIDGANATKLAKIIEGLLESFVAE